MQVETPQTAGASSSAAGAGGSSSSNGGGGSTALVVSIPNSVDELLIQCRLTDYSVPFDDQGYDDLPFLISIANDREKLDELAGHVGFKPGHKSKFEWALGRIAASAGS